MAHIDPKNGHEIKKVVERPGSSKMIEHHQPKSLIVKNDGEKKVPEKKNSIDRKTLKITKTTTTAVIHKMSRNSINNAYSTNNTNISSASVENFEFQKTFTVQNVGS